MNDLYSWKTIDRTNIKSLLFYGKNKIKYIASCQIEFRGNKKAYIHTLNGNDFYKILIHSKLKPFTELDLNTVFAEVTTAHVKLMERAFKGLAVIEVLDEYTVGEGSEAISLSSIKVEIIPGLEADCSVKVAVENT